MIKGLGDKVKDDGLLSGIKVLDKTLSNDSRNKSYLKSDSPSSSTTQHTTETYELSTEDAVKDVADPKAAEEVAAPTAAKEVEALASEKAAISSEITAVETASPVNLTGSSGSKIPAKRKTGAKVSSSSAEHLKQKEINTNVQEASKQLKNANAKRGKEVTKAREKKARRTLLEDQREVNKKYSEKIIEQNLGYTCRMCDFATGIYLKAKTHAVSCGSKRKKSVKKIIDCQQCEDKFKGKAELHKHFQRVHQSASYKCSKCGRSYKLRKSYMLHLKSHDSEFLDRFKCKVCDYKTRDNWLLERHMQKKHSDKVKNLVSGIIAELIASMDCAAELVDDTFDLTASGHIQAHETHCDPENNTDQELIECVDHDLTEDDANNVTSYESVDGDTIEDSDISYEADEILVNDETRVNQTNMIGLSKEPCQWEQIRLEIITEREKMIAESGILEDISELKRDMIHNNEKLKKRKSVEKNKKESSTQVRRSDRIKTNTEETLVGEVDGDGIKLEIKIELMDFDDTHKQSTETKTVDKITTVPENVNNKDQSDLDVNDHEHNNNAVVTNELDENDSRVTNGGIRTDDANEIRTDDTNEIVETVSEASETTVVGSKRVKKYRCDKCAYTTIDNYHLKRHDEMHFPSQVQCLKCDEICDTRYQYIEHSKTCFYRCPYFGCSKNFKIESKFEGHKRNHIKMLRRLV